MRRPQSRRKTESGFTANHSCETILIKITDKWLKAMDKGLFTGVVMIDLRKAFDVVDHKLLLKKRSVYGLNTNSLKLFQSFLSGRYQKVYVDGKLSEPLGIHSGVPQECIVGPALFLLFINDLPLVLKNNIGIYTDASTLYASAPTLAEVEEKIRPDIDAVSMWAKENKMKMHPAKTKYIIISTRQKLQIQQNNLLTFQMTACNSLRLSQNVS